MLRSLYSKLGRLSLGHLEVQAGRPASVKSFPKLLQFNSNFHLNFLNQNQSQRRLISTSAIRRDLMEFFDNEKNWGELNVRTGRSWTKDELRIKGNTDLHKLWYILLKERNMLFTMEYASETACEHFPNPERIDKVEESMRNLEEVVRERNRAYFLLETGETGERPGAEEENFLGLPEYRQFEEYRTPKNQNKEYLKAKSEEPVVSRSEKAWFLRHWREKQNKTKAFDRIVKRRRALETIRKFPNVDIEALKEKYPDANIEIMIDRAITNQHSINIRPKRFRGHTKHF